MYILNSSKKWGISLWNRILYLEIIAFILLISGCTNMSGNNNASSYSPPKTIKDIAFDINKEYEFTIYIKEKDSYEPYLVIDSNYDKGVLLLKKYLEGENIYFNPQESQGTRGGYYPNSNVDSYLNSDFKSRFTTSLQNKILDTTISVTTKDGVGSGGGKRETENIQRKIFLLSATELNIKAGMACVEGRPLAYFKGNKNFIATNKKGDAMSYWLRTAYLWSDIQAWSIGITGGGAAGGDLVSLTLAVRPAFCIDGNTAIKEMDGIIEGKKVYTLDIQ